MIVQDLVLPHVLEVEAVLGLGQHVDGVAPLVAGVAVAGVEDCAQVNLVLRRILACCSNNKGQRAAQNGEHKTLSLRDHGSDVRPREKTKKETKTMTAFLTADRQSLLEIYPCLTGRDNTIATWNLL